MCPTTKVSLRTRELYTSLHGPHSGKENTFMTPDTYTGIVQGDSGEGKRLGFPTANIPLRGTPSGIYAGVVTVDGEKYPSAIYADEKRQLLEAHLLDFNTNIYGKTIEITLLKKIRDDAQFTDEAALTKAITKDVEDVRMYFEKL